MCDHWRESFQAFIDDMGPRPGPQYGLGRLDPNANYIPENCRWMTKGEQLAKRRRNNKKVRQIGPLESTFISKQMGI